MKLTQKDINSLVSCRRLPGMPKGTYVAGFVDYDGLYRPIYTLDAFFYAGIHCELYTYLTHTHDGTEFYLRFFFF